jgi:hypothetical protein
MTKNPYSEVLNEIESGLWEHDARVDLGIAQPYVFNDMDFRACTKIFMSGLMWKMWENQEKEKTSFENRCKEAEDVGHKLNVLLEIYTGINLKDLY